MYYAKFRTNFIIDSTTKHEIDNIVFVLPIREVRNLSKVTPLPSRRAKIWVQFYLALKHMSLSATLWTPTTVFNKGHVDLFVMQ